MWSEATERARRNQVKQKKLRYICIYNIHASPIFTSSLLVSLRSDKSKHTVRGIVIASQESSTSDSRKHDADDSI